MKRLMALILTGGMATLLPGIVSSVVQAQTVPYAPPQGMSGTQEVQRPQSNTGLQVGTQAAPEDISRVPMVAGDLLNIQVFNAPALSGVFTVDSSGDLGLPLVGKIHVQGLNLSESQTKIADALSHGFILHPSVSITVQQYVPTYVTILGEVQSPGRYPLLAPHPLQQVVAMAGGPTILSSGTAEISRKTQGAEQKFDVELKHNIGAARGADEPQVQPGDEITVLRAGVVYVLGAVFRPGGYVMQEKGSLNVVQAIALASGTTMQASIHSMRVIRRNSDGSLTEIDMDYRRMMAGKLPPFTLHPQDIVYVPVSKTKAVLTGGASGVFAAATSAAIYTVP